MNTEQNIPEIPKNETTVPKEEQIQEPGFLKEYKKEIVIGVIIILMLIFIFQNMDETIFTLFWVKMRFPLVILILMFFSIGAISVWVYSYFHKKELKRKIRTLEAELKKLKGK
jgi:uncharacterized integral membrane protein